MQSNKLMLPQSNKKKNINEIILSEMFVTPVIKRKAIKDITFCSERTISNNSLVERYFYFKNC